MRKFLSCLVVISMLCTMFAFGTTVAADDGSNSNEAKIGTTEYETLKAAFDAVNDSTPTTITLLKDVQVDSAWDIIIAKERDITLDINGHTLTGKTTGFLSASFTVLGKFTLKDSAETKGLFQPSQDASYRTGGLIKLYGGSGDGNPELLVDGVNISSGNIQEVFVPAIYAYGGDGGKITLKNTTITGYHSAGTDSGFTKGSAVYMESGSSLEMKNSSIIDCSNASEDGGAIYVTGGSVTMDADCVISGCTSGGNGGGVYVGKNSSFIMKGGSITGCKAVNGGGVYLEAPAVTDDKTSELKMTGGSITGCKATGNGGAVYNDGDFWFEGDVALSGNAAGIEGGAIYNGGQVIFNCSKSTVSGNTVDGAENNIYMTNDGSLGLHTDLTGAVGLHFEDADLNKAGATIIGNANQTSRTFYLDGSDSIFITQENNVGVWTAFEASIKDTIYPTVKDAFAASTDGDTIKLLCDSTLSNTITIPSGQSRTLDLNSFTLDASVTTSTDANAFVINGDFTLKDGTKTTGKLVDKQTVNEASLMMVSGQNAKFTLENAELVGGKTHYPAVYLDDNAASFKMKDATITGFSTDEDLSPAAVYVGNSSSFTMIGGTISDCSSKSDGGAVFFADLSIGCFENATITNCSTEGRGGAFYLSDGTSVNITGTNEKTTNISGCSAKMAGGAIWNQKGDLEISNTKFSDNSSIDDSDSDNGYGGAIYNVTQGILTLKNVTIDGCVAVYGGGIYNAGTLSLKNVKMDDCSAAKGGAIYNWRMLNLEKVVIDGCNAQNGGGIYNDYQLQMDNTEIKGCSATEHGGGIFAADEQGQSIQFKNEIKIQTNTNGSKADNIYMAGEGGFYPYGDMTGYMGINYDYKQVEEGQTFMSDLAEKPVSAANGNYYSCVEYIFYDGEYYYAKLNGLTPIWAIEKFTVKFDVQGHGSDPQDQTIGKGKLAMEPEAPTEDERYFVGWFKEETCETAWDFSTDVVLDNVKLYAKWLPVADEPAVKTELVYTGSEQTGVEEGKEGFTFSGTTAATNAGEYTVTATLGDNCCWSDGSTNPKELKWTIAKKDISNASVSAITDQDYTGEAVCPAPTVTVEGKNLTVDTDYELSYSDNVNVGTATITISGKGNYTGSMNATFIIVKVEPPKPFDPNVPVNPVDPNRPVDPNVPVNPVNPGQPAFAGAPVAPTIFKILDGDGQTYVQDSGKTLTFRGSGELDDFLNVMVDVKVVDAKYYKLSKGSTIVELSEEYLKTLSVGKHTLTMTWKDGTATATFTIQAPALTKTGDAGTNYAIAGLLLIALAGACMTTVSAKNIVKKRREE